MSKIKPFETDQEEFWAGNFGSEYIQRNNYDLLLSTNLDFFARALRVTRGIQTCIEFGSNIGMNLKALKLLRHTLQLHAIEINAEAVQELAKIIPSDNILHGSILNFNPSQVWDLVLIKGVLIHIAPDALPKVYDKLVASTGKYLLVAEYYNPTPVAVPYRGHTDRLFKRDFAGEIMDRHPNLQLLDYGFCYRRDPNYAHGDGTWFLMEKNC